MLLAETDYHELRLLDQTNQCRRYRLLGEVHDALPREARERPRVPALAVKLLDAADPQDRDARCTDAAVSLGFSCAVRV